MRFREFIGFVAACITIVAAVFAIRSCQPENVLPISWSTPAESDNSPSGSTPSSSDASIVKRVSSEVAGWQSAGIEVSAGETLAFSASGSVTHWRGDGRVAKCGPNGSGQGACSGHESCCLAPGLGNNALVGKIGSASAFLIGSSKTLTASTSGTLYLGMNDTVHCGGCADNDGSWTVRVEIR